jgi:D-alanyl-D-alanine carboxypeptidase (penicillin-binding protein 5/6)
MLALAVRLATEDPPPLAVRVLLPVSVRLPGDAPALAWPREGEAAVEVEGLGTLGTSGGSTPVPIASVAKVMTAYLTLLRYPLTPAVNGFRMTVTAADVADERERASLGQSVLTVSVGERLTERQALEALLLPSANNIAAMLAVHDAGSIAAFVALMNATAKELHMDSTVYTDPSGFDDSTVSTAEDQLKLARVAISRQTFAAIVDERSAALPLAGLVSNLDGLVGTDGYVGIKTGSDRAAGGCLMFARRVAVAGRHLTILGVVLGQHAGSLISAALAGAERLGDSAAGAIPLETVLPAGATVLSVRAADGRRTSAVLSDALAEVGWGGLALPVQVIRRQPLPAVRAGEVVANVIVRGVRGSTSAAVAAHALGKPGFDWRVRNIL